MSFLLRNLARYTAQKVASNPRAREKAVEVARAVIGEAREIAGREDRPRAAGQAVRRAFDRLTGDGLTGDKPGGDRPPGKRSGSDRHSGGGRSGD